jgi:putative transposase
MKQARRDPGLARRWQAFLRNHRKAITAMDFFTVPTITFNLLSASLLLAMTGDTLFISTSLGIRPAVGSAIFMTFRGRQALDRQLREAFPYESAPKFLLFDHDYGLEAPAALRSLQITGVRTSIRSPWQNGVAERWVGSCRRGLLDHIIALNERHLKRLLSAYASYYHEDRTHLGLRKETPGRRIRMRTSWQN